MGAPAPGAPSPWVQLIPFVLVLGIFYFVILLPMKRRQQKVAGVPGGAEGRRPGHHLRRHLRHRSRGSSDQSVQLQIANNVRIEVSRAAIVGYQGQEPVVAETRKQSVMKKNLRWKLRHHRRRRRPVGLGVLPAAAEGQPRPRPQGRRPPGAARADRRRAAARDRDDGRAAARDADARRRRSSRELEATGADRVRGRGHRRTTQAFRDAAVDADTVFDRVVGRRRATPSRMQAERRQPAARRRGDAGAADDRAPRQRARRGRADRRAPGRRRTRSWCSCPASTDVQRAKEIIRSTALLELKLVEQGPFPTQEAALQAYNNVLPPDVRDPARAAPRAPAPARTPGTVYYVVQQVAGGHRPRPAQRPAVARREQPAGGQLHAEAGRRARGSARSPQANIGRQLAIVLDNRVMSAPTHPGAHHRRRADHRHFTREEMRRTWSLTLQVGRAAGVADLPRGAHRRAVARRRLDPRRRDGVARRPGCSSCCSCSSTTS